MHEMSMALEVVRLVERELDHHPGRLLSVGLLVGDDAGLEPESLAFCLEAVLAHPPFDGARPVITRTAGDALRLEYVEIDDGRPDD
jgi:Zn finger protein HypA/HybF involved in hydrogenase expression